VASGQSLCATVLEDSIPPVPDMARDLPPANRVQTVSTGLGGAVDEETPVENSVDGPAGYERPDAGGDQTVFVTRGQDGLTLAMRQDPSADGNLLAAALPIAALLPQGLTGLNRIVVNGRVVYQKDGGDVSPEWGSALSRKRFSFSC
jgi:hypothetical protein